MPLFSQTVPSGTIMMYGGSSAPSGWLKCDGTEGSSGNVSRTTYADLFSALGTTYGVGDGSTTFGLPNFAGIFPRGSGTQTISGKAYTGTRGTAQGDQLQGHWHVLRDNPAGGAIHGFQSSNGFTTSTGNTADQNVQAQDLTSDGTNGTPRTGDETRPANLGVLYIIKA